MGYLGCQVSVKKTLFILLFVVGNLSFIAKAGLAQIVPDTTLGAESSTIIPDTNLQGQPTDLIEGGALRESNLFHSFLEFNIGEGERIYFASPLTVDQIFSRVTGTNSSNIFGMLGVDGTADLYLLNPHGVIFGPDASLDIEGSFAVSTADSIVFADGSEFSAIAPSSSVLTVNVPLGLQLGPAPITGSAITNQGTLAVGQDLTLLADTLILQGQLAAGENLTLQGTNTVQIRDTDSSPFIAAAVENLLIQGNETVDIFALNHPDSGLYAGGNLILRSTNPVGGDAHYYSGGDYRIEQLNSTLGSLHSPHDPIIRSQGDVSLFAYQGASLHILAGGAVDIGTAVIVSPDQTGASVNPVDTPSLANVALSDGTILEINGSTRPTLDVRAGVALDVIGDPLGTTGQLSGFFFDTPTTLTTAPENNPSATSANITIGDIFFTAPDGLVLLTNQYIPGAEPLAGNIVINGEGVFGDGIDVTNPNGKGGSVYLDSRHNIDVIDSFIDTASLEEVGDIVLLANDAITFDSTDAFSFAGANSSIPAGVDGVGGDIRITATALNVLNGAQLGSNITGSGEGGDIIINLKETARFEGINRIFGFPSRAITAISTNGEAQAGNIEISAQNLEVSGGAEIISINFFGEGNAGNVILDISETVRFEGSNPINNLASGAFSRIDENGQGQGGNVQITAENLEVLSGAQISASSFGIGDAGNVILDVRETARFTGSDPGDDSPSGAFSRIGSASSIGEGNGGDVRISARNLEVLNGANLGVSTFGIGDAGNLILNVQETARFDGVDPSSGGASGASSGVGFNGEGNGGDIQLSARNLAVTNGGQIGAGTQGVGNAGSILLEVSETARFEGSNPTNGTPSGAFTTIELTGEGQGQDLQISTGNLEVLNGAVLSAATFGIGDAGNVVLDVRETARFDGIDPIDSSPSGAFSNVELSGRGKGGDLIVSSTDLYISGGAGLSAGSLGQGDAGDVFLTVLDRLESTDGTIATNSELNAGGQIQIVAGTIFLFGNSDIQTFVNSGADNGGNVSIVADALVAFNDSDIFAFAADGRGGDVDLSRTAFFGQNFRFAAPGTDLRTLNNNSRVDINATGRLASGTISLPDVSFIEDSLTELPETLIDTETLVASSCISPIAQGSGRLIITGIDGIPQQPDSTGSVAIPTGVLHTALDKPIEATETESGTTAVWQIGTPIAEPQGVYQLTDGRFVLSRECSE